MIKAHFRNRFGKYLPNAVTILIVALLLVVFQAYAMPDSIVAADASVGVVSYQGQLMDATGEPVDGKVDITFRLYNVPSEGSALWTEAHTGANTVPVNNGLFHVLLGSLNPIPAGVWSNQTVYLGIKVATDSEMTPREVVGRVAYALAADRAITAYGLSASDGTPADAVSVDASGNVKVLGDYYGKGHFYLHAYEGDGQNGTAYIQARDNSGTSDISLQFRTQNDGVIVEAMNINKEGDVVVKGSFTNLIKSRAGGLYHGTPDDWSYQEIKDVDGNPFPYDGQHQCFLQAVVIAGTDEKYPDEQAGCKVIPIDKTWHIGLIGNGEAYGWCEAMCFGW